MGNTNYKQSTKKVVAAQSLQIQSRSNIKYGVSKELNIKKEQSLIDQPWMAPQLKNVSKQRSKLQLDRERNGNVKNKASIHTLDNEIDISAQKEFAFEVCNPSPSMHQCYECGITTDDLQDLQQHMETVHMKKEPQEMKQCTDFVANNVSLNNIVEPFQVVNYKIRPYKCKFCDYLAAQKVWLIKHTEDMHQGTFLLLLLRIFLPSEICFEIAHSKCAP